VWAHVECVEALLERGADPLVRTKAGGQVLREDFIELMTSDRTLKASTEGSK